MIGRAGRPGYDDEGIAVIMCTEDKKDFYKKVCLSLVSDGWVDSTGSHFHEHKVPVYSLSARIKIV